MSVDRGVARNKRFLRTRPYFNKNQDLVIQTNQIELVLLVAPVTSQHTITEVLFAKALSHVLAIATANRPGTAHR